MQPIRANTLFQYYLPLISPIPRDFLTEPQVRVEHTFADTDYSPSEWVSK